MRSVLLLATGAILLLGAAGAWQLGRLREGPDLPGGERLLAGLSSPVEVRWDSLGVPHVWAETLEDAVFAQGWLHARDRLWQMELFGRVLEGRLSELFGERTLPSDRFLRTVGLARAAEGTVASLDPETRRVLEAYAAGVDAAVDGWEGPLPPEFVLLRARPEPWSVRRVVGMEKIMAWDLAEYGETLSLALARRALDDAGWGHVRPRYPDWGPVIVEDPDRSAGVEDAPPAPRSFLPSDPALLVGARIPDPARAFLSRGSVVRASNAWVVGGERSRSGRPILANDMHLGLDAPTLWYLIALHAPGLDVVGMSLPGAPGIVAGRTRGVAWGFTNGSVDDSDFFVERADSADPSRYLTPGGSAPFAVRTEVIRVRGRGEDTLRVRSTRHGPVITPVEPRAGSELLAFRWVGHEPSTTAAAILAMNRARTAREFVRALSRFSNPHQNVVFADTAGAFGYWLAGRVPLRAGGRVPLLPVPGWTGE
ncbi:MAG TPA: penicillin acylase family protein, partial [Longimicrobiales bacterium]|nr:penicillin acylase family protein [Longimicrobiales bacterium]